LDKLRIQEKVDGIIVNGDIAYDLDSNNGKNYEEMLNLISRQCRYIPIFLNTGNHEHHSTDDLKFFYNTFEQYDKNTKLATGLSIGNLYLIGFDPYKTLYS
jgi:DNA repair exonuclease SbcCD nuclease subunit